MILLPRLAPLSMLLLGAAACGLTPATGPLYRPRLVGHRIGPYAARATAESCSSLTASGGLKPCRSISQVAL